MLTFDADGLIARMQGYDDRAVAEHDLALRAAGPPADAPGRPPPAVSGLVAFVHVADMARSLAFYRRLGFAAVDSYAPHDEVVWAFLESGPAQLMLARADAAGRPPRAGGPLLSVRGRPRRPARPPRRP